MILEINYLFNFILNTKYILINLKMPKTYYLFLICLAMVTPKSKFAYDSSPSYSFNFPSIMRNHNSPYIKYFMTPLSLFFFFSFLLLSTMIYSSPHFSSLSKFKLSSLLSWLSNCLFFFFVIHLSLSNFKRKSS